MGLVRNLAAAYPPGRVGVLALEDRSSRIAADTFLREAAKRGRAIPPTLCWRVPTPSSPASLPALEPVLARIATARPAALVVFAPRSMTAAVKKASGRYSFGTVIDPLAHVPVAKSFRVRYHKRYGSAPGPDAALGYDAARLLTEAAASSVRNGQVSQDALQSAVARIAYQGATGVIRFDRRGNRIGL